MLLDTCCFHPFAQYNFNGCRSDLEFVEDGLAILWLWHPLQGICTERYDNILLCLDLLLFDVLRLAIHRIVNVLRLQSEHVAPSKTSEAREEECLLDDRVTARCSDHLLQFINGRNSFSAFCFCGFSFLSSKRKGVTVTIPSRMAFSMIVPKRLTKIR